MVAISVKADIEAAMKGLNAFSRRQMPFAAQTAINDVAFQVQRAEIAAIPRVFKSPRPFTRKSVIVTKANKSTLAAGQMQASIFIRPEVAKYLDPYEFGGVHVLPGQTLLIPIKQSVDAYGQLRKGTAKRLAGRADVFVGEAHGQWGFWQRIAAQKRRKAGLRLLLAFGVNKPVKQHLDFESRGLDLVRRAMPAAMLKALTAALASAR